MSKNGSTPTLPAETMDALHAKEHKVSDCKAAMSRRVSELKSEFEAGQKMLGDLDTKASDLKTTLLRISGAIQVLEELISEKEEG